jgi:hypothetical protein
MKTSEEYLDRVTRIPGTIIHGPSPGGGSLNMSQPDEGSIAEKEYGAGYVEYGEKDGEGTGEDGVEVVEEAKDRGFFSPDIVEKELAGLGVMRIDSEGNGSLV